MDHRASTAQMYRNRRFAVGFLASLLVLSVCWLLRPGPVGSGVSTVAQPAAAAGAAGRPLSQDTQLTTFTTVTGGLTPKSVTASRTGQVLAAHMMYGHSVTVHGPDGTVQKTIPDAVDLTRLGQPGHPGISKGAPVEGAFTPDGQAAYVSNFAMSGQGFGPEPKDTCKVAKPGAKLQTSYLYRVDLTAGSVSHAIPVGAVPKSVAVTPDGRLALVANWCSDDLTVVDTGRNTVLATVPVGKLPLGLAISPDSRTGYVAVSGSAHVVSVDLGAADTGTATAQPLAQTEAGPRALALSPDGRVLYVAANDAGVVVKVDTATRGVLQRVTVGKQPRSLALSSDGTALFVGNYGSATVTKLRTSDLSPLQEVKVAKDPVGLAYEPTTGRLWVACYSGSLVLMDDTGSAPASASTPVTAPGPTSGGMTPGSEQSGASGLPISGPGATVPAAGAGTAVASSPGASAVGPLPSGPALGAVPSAAPGAPATSAPSGPTPAPTVRWTPPTPG